MLKDEKYKAPSGAELGRRRRKNLKESFVEIIDKDTGKLLKVVKGKKDMDSMENHF